MAAKGYSSSLDSEYNSLTLTLIPPRVPGASEQDCSQQSLCAFSYAAFVSPRNNLMLEKKKKSPNRKQKSTFQLLLPPQVNTKHLPGDVELRADSRRVQPSFTPRSSAYKPWPIGCSPRIYSPTKPVIPERGILVKQELCVVLLACYS